MKPENLLNINIQWRVSIDMELIHRLRELHPEYEIFNSISDSDFYIFRKKVGESTFFKDKEKFIIPITRNIKVHCSQIFELLKDYSLTLQRAK